jgi:hypothetical protein
MSINFYFDFKIDVIHKIDSILKDYYLTVLYSLGTAPGLMSGYGLRLKFISIL